MLSALGTSCVMPPVKTVQQQRAGVVNDIYRWTPINKLPGNTARIDSKGNFSNNQSTTNGEAFGQNANIIGATNNTAFGYAAGATGGSSATVGSGSGGTGFGIVCMGYSAGGTSGCGNIVAIGYQALCALSTAGGSVAVGANAQCNFGNSIALGSGAKTDYSATGAIAIGNGSEATLSNQCVIGAAGAATGFISSLYFGVTAAAPQAISINACGGAGSNIAGANIALAGGKGTGSAVGGDIVFQVALAGAAGSALNSLTTVGKFSGTTGIFSTLTTGQQQLQGIWG